MGEVIAFDAWKGRLWAVCPACGRWNLAPIEERWEAVESAEKRFRDSRLRVHSENVRIAQLPEGTRLVRVGDALPGEVAAWRYGRELRGRRAIYWRDEGGALTLSESRLSMTRRLRARGTLSPRRLDDSAILALEMVLHEETERRALEGELRALEEQWREAEEIAGIAALLPEDPLPRSLHRK